jgi:hypothetical protein
VGERHRLAGLASAAANVLLVMFVLAVALPLLPPKLADPFWLLAFTGTFCTNGFQRRRLVVLGFLVLLPLQGLAAWRGLEAAQSLAYRAGRVQQARLAQFRPSRRRISASACRP